MKALGLFIASILMVGCNGSDDEQAPVNIDDFTEVLVSASGAPESRCGVAAVGELSTDVAQCAQSSFTSEQPFYAVFEQNGSSGDVAVGLTMNQDLEVAYWHFDSDFEDGSHRLLSFACLSPVLADELTPGASRPIECENDNLVVTTVDESQMEYAVSELSWRYVGSDSDWNAIACGLEQCSHWVFPADVSGDVEIQAYHGETWPDDPLCANTYRGTAEYRVVSSFHQELTLEVVFDGAICQ